MTTPSTAGGPELTRRYTLLGALVGLLFPLTAWSLDLFWVQRLPPSLAALWALHLNNPLHWIIDIAPIILALAAREIGRRVSSEQALRDSEASARSVLAALAEGIVVQDQAGRILSCNASAERILGLTADQLIGRTSLDPRWRTVREDGAPLPGDAHPAMLALRTGQPVTGVVLGVHKPDDRLNWISVNAHPLTRPGEPQPFAVVVSFADITEQRRLDEALRGERDFGRQVMTTVGQGLVVTDRAHRLEYVNPAFARMLGYTPEALLGLPAAALTMPEDLATLTDAHVRRERGEASTYELRLKRADGSALPVSVTATPRQEAGALTGAVSVITDLSERLRAEATLADGERRFRTLTTLAPVGIFQADLDGDWIFVNDRWRALTGQSQALALGAGWTEAIHADDRERVLTEWQSATAGRRSFELEYRLCAPQGAVTWVRGSAAPIHNKSGKVDGYIGTLIDITESKLAEEAITGANERLIISLAEVEQRSQEITTLNTMSGLLQSSLSAEEAYAVVGRLVPQLFAGKAGQISLTSNSRNLVEAEAVWGDQGAAEQVFTPQDCWALRRGRLHWSEPGSAAGLACRHVGAPAPFAHVCAPMLAQGEALGVLTLIGATPDAVFSEAERQLAQTVADSLALALANLRLRETLRNQSVRDPLTGLFNRRYMEETLERELRRASRQALPIGVVVLDLDHFKHFNDTFGHAAGDLLLRELAALLRANIRAEDVPCRYGGEEFVLILPGAPPETVQQRAERICQEVAHLQASYNGQLLGQVTLSLGVATFPEHGSTVAGLLRTADAALYRAKRQGRNQVVIAEAGEA